MELAPRLVQVLGFMAHGLLSVLLLSVVSLPGAFSRHLFLSKRTRPGLRPNTLYKFKHPL